MKPRTYTVLTWDCATQCYTPHEGLESPSVDVSIHGLRAALKELRSCGYSCHRRRSPSGSYHDNDRDVLVERTDCDEELLEALEQQ